MNSPDLPDPTHLIEDIAYHLTSKDRLPVTELYDLLKDFRRVALDSRTGEDYAVEETLKLAKSGPRGGTNGALSYLFNRLEREREHWKEDPAEFLERNAQARIYALAAIKYIDELFKKIEGPR